MKINKAFLTKIIKEEINEATRSRDTHPTMEINPADLEALHGPGRSKIEKDREEARKVFDEILSTAGAEKLASAMFDRISPNQVLRFMYNIQSTIETLQETPQSGGSQPRQKTDFDLKYTSTNVSDREKQKNLRHKIMGSKPGGRKKHYKKQSTKADRELGKKLARGDKE